MVCSNKISNKIINIDTDIDDAVAPLYQCCGEYWSVVRKYDKAIEVFIKQLDKLDLNDINYSLCLFKIAGLYEIKKKYDKSLNIYKLCLTLCETIIGDNDVFIASCLRCIAGVYFATGEYDKALLIYEQSLDIYKLIFGNNHFEVATNLNYIANVYDIKGDYVKALSIYEDTLKIRMNLYSEKDSEENYSHVTKILNNIEGVKIMLAKRLS